MTLIDLVHKLAREHQAEAVVDGQKVVRPAPAWLDVLADAKHSTTTSGPTGKSAGGGGGPRWEAVQLEARIYDELRADLIRLCGDTHKVLIGKAIVYKWLVEFLASMPLASEEAAWEAQLAAWIEEIRNLVDPPKRVEILEPCFICGQTRHTRSQDDDTIEVQALALTYRVGAIDETASLVCEKCGPLARGTGAVQLAASMTRAIPA